MLELIKLSGNVFFTADTHFNHANMIKYCHRPFLNPTDQHELDRRGGKWHNGNWKDSASTWKISKESVELTNTALINNINAIVKPEDTLIHAGDFACWNEKNEHYANQCREIRNRINCKNIMITWGNHDNQRLISHLFQESGSEFLVRIQGKTIHVCHCAHTVWYDSHRGALHCYGHSHATVEEALEKLMPERRCLDVGVDNAARLQKTHRPFLFDEINRLIGFRSGFVLNPHTPTDYQGPKE